MSFSTSLTLIVCGFAVISCGKETDSKDEIIRSEVGLKDGSSSGVKSAPAANKSTGSASTADSNKIPSSTCETAPKPAGVVPFTFAEAKAACVACHSSTGMAKAKWGTADGTEAQWAAVAAQLRAPVVAGSMPMPAFNATDKARFLAFLDTLSAPAAAQAACPPAAGGTGGTGGTGGGAGPVPGAPSGPGTPSGPSTPPAPVQPKTYDFASARALCVGCHSSQSPASIREQPYLETAEQWRNNKRDIEKEVSRGSMPMGNNLSSEDRAALLRFIQSL